jgi:hypothetical protein
MHQALMDASVATDKAAYLHDEEVAITVTVADGEGPVEGVAVHLLLTSPSGAALGGNSLTSEEGVATVSHRVNAARGSVGVWVLEAVTSKRGFESVTALASFQVSA